MISIDFNKYRFILFLIVVFLFPIGDNFRIYVSSVFVSMMIFIIDYNYMKIQKITYILFFIIAMLVFSLNFRTLVLGIDYNFVKYLREYTEVFRFFILLMLSFNSFKFNFKYFRYFVYFTIAYIFIDFAATIGELYFRSSDFSVFISENYHAGRHAAAKQYIKGLSPQGSIHAMIANILFALHFFLLPYVKRKFLFILPILFESFIVLTSGSRTHVIGLIFMIILFIFLLPFKSKILYKKSKIQVRIIIIGLLASVYLVSTYPQYFFKLIYLINNIEAGDSKNLGGRGDIWNSMVNYLLKEPFYFIIGWGKIYMLEVFDTFFTDNDYLAFLIAYGIIPSFLVLITFLKFTLNTFQSYINVKPLNEILFFIIIQSFLVSLASNGFFTFQWQLLTLIIYKFYCFEETGEINLKKISRL